MQVPDIPHPDNAHSQRHVRPKGFTAETRRARRTKQNELLSSPHSSRLRGELLFCYRLTTVPFSHDSIAASMMRWHLSASSALASTLSGGVCFTRSSTHASMRLWNVSPKLRMLPRNL